MATDIHGQLLARHRANHVNIAYAPNRQTAVKALAVKASMLNQLGVHVHLCGDVKIAPAVRADAPIEVKA